MFPGFSMMNMRFAKVLKQVTSRTVEFMVFIAEDHPREKKIKQLFYTVNIGHLCIFLEHGEPLSELARILVSELIASIFRDTTLEFTISPPTVAICFSLRKIY